MVVETSGLVTLMCLKEQQNSTTSTTDLNNNCFKTDDHLTKQVNLQLKRSSTEDGLNRTSLEDIELKEFNYNVTNNSSRTTSPISPNSHRQPSPSQLSINSHHSHQNHSKCNGVCVITNEPKACNKQPPNLHRHLITSHSNGSVAPQKIQIQLNGSAFFSPSIKSPNALNASQSPIVPSSYLSNSSKYTGYSTYGKLHHGTEHLNLQNTSNLCIDNLHSKTKIYNFKVVIVGDMAAGKTSYIRKLTQSKNGCSRNRYNYYMATKGVEAKCKLFDYDDNTLVNLEFWEIGGQENPNQITDMFCRDAFGCVLFFDCSNKQSLDSLLQWKQSLDAAVRLIDNKPIPTVLVANKCDLESATNQPWLKPETLDLFCKRNNILTFYYASVRRNVNLENICYDLIAEMLVKYQRKEYNCFDSNYRQKKSLKKFKKFYRCSHCTIL